MVANEAKITLNERPIKRERMNEETDKQTEENAPS